MFKVVHGEGSDSDTAVLEGCHETLHPAVMEALKVVGNDSRRSALVVNENSLLIIAVKWSEDAQEARIEAVEELTPVLHMWLKLVTVDGPAPL